MELKGEGIMAVSFQGYKIVRTWCMFWKLGVGTSTINKSRSIYSISYYNCKKLRQLTRRLFFKWLTNPECQILHDDLHPKNWGPESPLKTIFTRIWKSASSCSLYYSQEKLIKKTTFMHSIQSNNGLGSKAANIGENAEWDSLASKRSFLVKLSSTWTSRKTQHTGT